MYKTERKMVNTPDNITSCFCSCPLPIWVISGFGTHKPLINSSCLIPYKHIQAYANFWTWAKPVFRTVCSKCFTCEKRENVFLLGSWRYNIFYYECSTFAFPLVLKPSLRADLLQHYIQFYINMKRKKSASVYFDQRRGEISQKEKLKGSWWAYHLYSLQTNIISKCLDLNFHIFSRFVSGIGQQIGGKSQSSEGRKQRKTRWVGSERTSLQPLLVFPV